MGRVVKEEIGECWENEDVWFDMQDREGNEKVDGMGDSGGCCIRWVWFVFW